MSGKLFLQIVGLIIIFALVMNVTKCLKKSYCPLAKSSTCEVSDAKAGK